MWMQIASYLKDKKDLGSLARVCRQTAEVLRTRKEAWVGAPTALDQKEWYETVKGGTQDVISLERGLQTKATAMEVSIGAAVAGAGLYLMPKTFGIAALVFSLFNTAIVIAGQGKMIGFFGSFAGSFLALAACSLFRFAPALFGIISALALGVIGMAAIYNRVVLSSLRQKAAVLSQPKHHSRLMNNWQVQSHVETIQKRENRYNGLMDLDDHFHGLRFIRDYIAIFALMCKVFQWKRRYFTG